MERRAATQLTMRLCRGCSACAPFVVVLDILRQPSAPWWALKPASTRIPPRADGQRPPLQPPARQEYRALSTNNKYSRHKRYLLFSKKVPAVRRGLFKTTILSYFVPITTPEPTVLPPSRIAKRRPSSIAIGVISSTSISMLSPGMHISTPLGKLITPVTSVVRK